MRPAHKRTVFGLALTTVPTLEHEQHSPMIQVVRDYNEATLHRMQAVACVLIVNDTTYLDWTNHPATTDLRPLTIKAAGCAAAFHPGDHARTHAVGVAQVTGLGT